MINNCAGGTTPWGTWLTCEENFNGYFLGPAAGRPSRKRQLQALSAFRRRRYAWGNFYDRFDVEQGAERSRTASAGSSRSTRSIPTSTPKKRTALGRFKHEGAAGIVNKDGRYVVYSGDDERFDYVYQFVTARHVDRDNPAANTDILDEGTLYVAKLQRRRHGRPGCRSCSAKAR